MGFVYINEQRLAEDEPNYVRQSFTISDLLTSPTQDGAIEGIRFLERETSEWRNYIDTLVQKVEKSRYLSEEEISRMRQRLESKRTLVDNSGILGINYTYSTGFNEHYFDFVSDSKKDVVAHVVVPQRKIITLPLIDPSRGDEDPFLFGKWNKAMYHGHFFYDGKIVDILKEFAERGFTFHEARPLTFQDKADELTELPCGGYVRIIKELALEEMVSFLNDLKK